MFWKNELVWAISIGLSFPILVIVLGEIIYSLKRDGKALATTLQGIKNLVLPASVLIIFVSKVLKIKPESNLIKIIETLFWVSVIHAFISLINAVLFSHAEADSWRGRVPRLLLDLSRFFLVILGSTIVLQVVWHADLAGLATAVGIGSIVIGLALQDTLGSIMSGIALLFEKPFQVGDWVKIGDIVGQVSEINWRSVRLLTHERDLVAIPHVAIATETILNESQPPGAGIETVEINFSLHDPPNLVKEVLKSTALSVPGILAQPEPEIHTLAYREYAIAYEIRFYLEDYGEILTIRDQLLSRIWYAAKRHNLTIPLPMSRVHVFDGLSLQTNGHGEKLIDSLNSIPSFQQLTKDRDSLDSLEKGTKLQHFGIGETVIQQNQTVEALYIIITGEVLLTVTDNKGVQQEVMKLSRGEFFGEIALFTGEKSRVSIKVLKDLEVMVIYSDTLRRIIDNLPGLAREIAQIIEARSKAISLAACS